jgi:hypothetical protein
MLDAPEAAAQYVRTCSMRKEPAMAMLVLGTLFGAFGLGYFIYGKRQQAPIALASGVLLMVFPFFVPNPWATFLIGAALLAVPWFVRI